RRGAAPHPGTPRQRGDLRGHLHRRRAARRPRGGGPGRQGGEARRHRVHRRRRRMEVLVHRSLRGHAGRGGEAPRRPTLGLSRRTAAPRRRGRGGTTATRPLPVRGRTAFGSMVPMTRFDSATAVVRVGENRYAAELDPGYLIGTAINGGYLMAVLQRAALAESDHPHAVSSSYHFHRPGGGGPAEIETEVVKRGRTVTTVLVTLRQEGRTVLTGTIATATLDSQAQPLYATPPAPVPPIGQCRSFDPRQGQLAEDGFLARVDVGLSPDSYAALLRERTADTPELYGYVDLSARDGGSAEDPAAFLPL